MALQVKLSDRELKREHLTSIFINRFWEHFDAIPAVGPNGSKAFVVIFTDEELTDCMEEITKTCDGYAYLLIADYETGNLIEVLRVEKQ